MGLDIHLQREEIAREAKRIAEEAAFKRAKIEENDREIAKLQEALRVKMAAQLAAQAAEVKAAPGEGDAGGQEERARDQDLDGEDEVIEIKSSSDNDNDDKRRIPVSNLDFLFYSY